MSFSETIFLFFLALIIFGPKKLPEIARQIGKVLNEFRRASNEFKSQIEQEIANLEVEDRKKTALPASSAPEGTASRTASSVPDSASTSAETTTLPATLAVSAEEPISAPHPSESATEALPSTEPPAASQQDSAPDSIASNPNGSDSHTPDAVTSPATQESHA